MKMWPFRKAKPIDTAPVITAGEVFELKSYDVKDPFPPKQSPTATVMETKSGWVRYQIGDGSFGYDDERMPIEAFLRCYRRQS